MHFAFEDDLSKFPNCLLDCKICTGYNGNHNLIAVIPELRDTVCFVDVPADNRKAISMFRDAKDRVVPGSNVFVVPIPCTEYIFIKTFLGYSTRESEIAIKFEDFRHIVRSSYGRSINTIRYEKFCKTLLLADKPCFRNGDFVSKDCLCSTNKQDCYELLLYSKKYRYAISFPVPILEAIGTNIQAMVDVAYKLYYSMASRFLEFGIIDIIHSID